jgi:hypothetical protein
MKKLKSVWNGRELDLVTYTQKSLLHFAVDGICTCLGPAEITAPSQTKHFHLLETWMKVGRQQWATALCRIEPYLCWSFHSIFSGLRWRGSRFVSRPRLSLNLAVKWLFFVYEGFRFEAVSVILRKMFVSRFMISSSHVIAFYIIYNSEIWVPHYLLNW